MIGEKGGHEAPPLLVALHELFANFDDFAAQGLVDIDRMVDLLAGVENRAMVPTAEKLTDLKE